MARRHRKRREKQVLSCRHCGRVFEGRVDALYCSPKCRVKAWQAKRAGRLQELEALAFRERERDRDRRLPADPGGGRSAARGLTPT